MKSVLREIVITAIMALVIFALLQIVIGTYEVMTSSMEPNLMVGERIVVNKIVYLLHPPRRGDIILFRYPEDPSQMFTKRVIGVPGDTVELKSGKVYINGIALEEPYKTSPITSPFAAQKIAAGQYFVLGDNRAVSLDSRYWGTVPRDNIIGKVWLTYWPPTRWGLAPNYSLAT